MRATRTDGSVVELERAGIERDTLRGERRFADADGRRGPVVIPVDSVRRLETRRVSVARTAGLVGVLLGGAFLVMSYLEAEEYGPGSR